MKRFLAKRLSDSNTTNSFFMANRGTLTAFAAGLLTIVFNSFNLHYSNGKMLLAKKSGAEECIISPKPSTEELHQQSLLSIHFPDINFYDASHLLDSDGGYCFQKIYPLNLKGYSKNYFVGQLGAFKYLIDPDTGMVVSKRYHEIYFSNGNLIGEIGARKEKIQFLKEDRSQYNKII